MCGRFTLNINELALEERFNSKNSASVLPIFNALPTQFLPVISIENHSTIDLMRWGMPFEINNSLKNIINTRKESILEKQKFKKLISTQRCLVLADSFIEWDKNFYKQPYRIMLSDNSCFAFAGIYDKYLIKNMQINCFSIITTKANSLVGKIHSRMPVILNRNIENEWINKNISHNEAIQMLCSFPAEQMIMHPISKNINDVNSNNPNNLIPIEINKSLFD